MLGLTLTSPFVPKSAHGLPVSRSSAATRASLVAASTRGLHGTPATASAACQVAPPRQLNLFAGETLSVGIFGSKRQTSFPVPGSSAITSLKLEQAMSLLPTRIGVTCIEVRRIVF